MVVVVTPRARERRRPCRFVDVDGDVDVNVRGEDSRRWCCWTWKWKWFGEGRGRRRCLVPVPVPLGQVLRRAMSQRHVTPLRWRWRLFPGGRSLEIFVTVTLDSRCFPVLPSRSGHATCAVRRSNMPDKSEQTNVG